jgi:hypothetical protein
MENIPKKIFVVPYRDRERFLYVYMNHMSWILEDEKDPYEIIISHQNDTRPFNRGAMKNLGFYYAKQKYPNHYKNIVFIFQDIDTMPGTKNIMDFNTTHGVVKHYFGYDFALGGIFSIMGSDFERINGFPNFWGWGFEDNTINTRCKHHKIVIDRSKMHPINSKMILQYVTGPYRMVDNKAVHKLITVSANKGLSEITNISTTINELRPNINMVNFTGWNVPEKYTDITFRADTQLHQVKDPIRGKNNLMNSIIHRKRK